MTLPETAQLGRLRRAAEVDRLGRTEALLDDPAVRGLLAPGTELDLRAVLKHVQRALEDPDDLWSDRPVDRAGVLHTEVFSVLAAALVREHGHDGGLLHPAATLAQELLDASRVRLPVTLALTPGGESMNRVAWLVRLRFPAASVWDLPVVAHEVGHHVVDTLESADERNRGARTLAQHVAETRDDHPRWTHEYAADVYATYVLGAAYPVACLTLRAGTDPRGTATHPPWAQRAELMAATLEAVSRSTGDGGAAVVADELVRPLWRRLPDAGDVGAADRARLRVLADDVVGLLATHAPASRFDDATRAVALVDDLGQGAPPPDDLPVRTVVDVAWRWRRRHWDADGARLRQVEATVLDWCTSRQGADT